MDRNLDRSRVHSDRNAPQDPPSVRAVQNPNAPQGLRDFFDRNYWPKKLGRSARTATLYRLTIDRFSEWLGRPALVDDLTDDGVCGFLQSRLECRAAETVDKERDKLCAIANFAAKKRVLREFLDVPGIKAPSESPQCWRRDHLVQLFSACRATPGRIGGAAAADWWLAFNALALFTGERTGALLSLRWEWLHGNVLNVPGRVRKTKHKAMTYLLPPMVVVLVERLHGQNGESPLIFQTHWARPEHGGSFYRHYTKLLERAGLPSSRKFKPQCLRRTFGSWLEHAGGDATRALGHGNRGVTERSYLDRGVTDAGKEGPGHLVERVLGLAI